MKCFRCFVFAAAVLVLGVVAARPVLADDITDPAITLSSSTTGPGASETFSWVFAPGATDGTISFENTSGVTWTSIEIVGDYSTSGHTFTCNVGTTFNTCPTVAVTPTTATFDYSGGTGVASGSYLSFQWINWNTNSGSSIPTFDFTANGGGSTGVPEPSSIALLAVGLFTLFGLVKIGNRRKATSETV
jgi:hypothetical protein